MLKGKDLLQPTVRKKKAHDKWTATYKEEARGAATSNEELTARALKYPDHGSRFIAEW